MPWNLSGVFSRTNGANSGSTTWEQDRSAGVDITAARHDNHDQDLADGINNCLAKDGQNAATGDIDFNGFSLVLDADGDTKIGSTSDDQIDFTLGGVLELSLTAAKADNLDDIAGLSHTNGSFLVSDGTDWVAEAGGTALTSLGVSAFAQTVLDDADASAARTTLGALGSGDDGSVLAGLLEQGTHTIAIPAGAMRPTVSNGCAALTDAETTAGRPDLQVLDFDASADEHAQFHVPFPKSWDEGTITFRVFWTSTATDTDGVAWGLQGVACSDGDTADVAYGTAVVVTDANQSTAEDVYVTAVSGAVTIGGTPAESDLCFFRIFRDVSDAADTASEDARLIGIQLFYTINAGDDS